MNKKLSLFFVWIILLFLGVGCTGLSSRLDGDRGNSFHQAIANQTLHPESAKNLEPVTGMDGEAAQAVTERYRKDFEKPEIAVPYTLTIGTIGKK
jgi:hypothetical protein